MPPQIIQRFNKFILDPLRAMFLDIEERLVPLANKKIRSQDVGRRREFDKLWKEYQEVYERKKIEETEYNSKIKEATKQGRGFSNSGSTTRFERFERKE